MPSLNPTTLATPTAVPFKFATHLETQLGRTQTVAKLWTRASAHKLSICAAVASSLRRVWSMVPGMDLGRGYTGFELLLLLMAETVVAIMEAHSASV